MRCLVTVVSVNKRMLMLALLVALVTLCRSAPAGMDDDAAAAVAEDDANNDDGAIIANGVEDVENTNVVAENDVTAVAEHFPEPESTTPTPSEAPQPQDNGHKLPCTDDEKRATRCGVHGDCFVLSIVARTTACVCHDGWTDNRCLTKSSYHVMSAVVMYDASFNVFITLAVVGSFFIIVLIVVIVFLALKTKTCQDWRDKRRYNTVERASNQQRK